MPQSRVALAKSLSDTLASLQSARSGLNNAWALRMSASEKAHFAAALGSGPRLKETRNPNETRAVAGVSNPGFKPGCCEGSTPALAKGHDTVVGTGQGQAPAPSQRVEGSLYSVYTA